MRVTAKFTVKTPYAANGRLGHTAFLTVIFTFARTSGAGLRHPGGAKGITALGQAVVLQRLMGESGVPKPTRQPCYVNGVPDITDSYPTGTHTSPMPCKWRS